MCLYFSVFLFHVCFPPFLSLCVRSCCALLPYCFPPTFSICLNGGAELSPLFPFPLILVKVCRVEQKREQDDENDAQFLTSSWISSHFRNMEAGMRALEWQHFYEQCLWIPVLFPASAVS